jgi:hypothetical protein
MKWYIVKLVYQVVIGEGNHTPQFDEQLRLITAQDETEAYEKAYATGVNEEVSFDNQKSELVHWKFINISELFYLNKIIDGAEIYSRINEVEDALAYTNLVNMKADSIKNGQSHQILNSF